jgi:hypothetical protein
MEKIVIGQTVTFKHSHPCPVKGQPIEDGVIAAIEINCFMETGTPVSELGVSEINEKTIVEFESGDWCYGKDLKL